MQEVANFILDWFLIVYLFLAVAIAATVVWKERP
jgi:hypothetical protein